MSIDRFFLCLLVVSLAPGCRQDRTSAGATGEPDIIVVAPQAGETGKFSALNSEQPQILVLGSTFSIARGLSPERGYAALLQQRLAAGGSLFIVLNASVAGETAAGALERLPYLLPSTLKKVVLELGQADEVLPNPPRAFSRDVKRLIRHIRARQPGLPILLLASSRTAAYYKPLATAAEEFDGVTLVALFGDTAGPARSDDATLHQKIAEQLFPLLEK
ncbi:MAG: hypothetical protein H6560_09025 [Lewinellaceae bacterium]|nr:hypothetical protein [Lewinellaceae bacterium]